MKLYSENNDYKLYQGNMLNMLEVIEPNTIDSIVTDPPYELNFMSKGWDNSGIAFQPDTWKKCYEVLKPGGYLLAFGGSRTFHRIACAIEDAGFEIRDTICWMYGSGFPKSMDISKQIDKRINKNKNCMEVKKFIKKLYDDNNINVKELSNKMGFVSIAGNWSNLNNVELPTIEQWNKLKKILNFENDEIENKLYLCRKEEEREVIGKKKSLALPINDQLKGWGKKREYDITSPATDLAKQWQGWGTALKPSFEPIIVARKPFKGSLVDNVLKWGVGGINIDECRIELNGDKKTTGGCKTSQENISHMAWKKNGSTKEDNSVGRFPANTILTYDETDFDEVCGGFPNTKSGSISKEYKQDTRFNIAEKGKGGNLDFSNWYGDSGSASRYFYCAKASKKDRDEGLDEFEDGNITDGRKAISDRPYLRKETPRKNIHPTVKPTLLMQYLVRLVTPNGGTVLDPFNGSGSTGKSVMYENKEKNKNYKYIGIELTEEYLPIAKTRIEYVCNLIEEEKTKDKQLSIFDEVTDENI